MPGQPETAQTPPASPPMPPAAVVVDLVSDFLARRPDVAEILAAVAERVAPVPLTNAGVTTGVGR